MMNKKVFGAFGLGVYQSSLNNGWDSYANRLDNGEFVNTHVSTKYAFKKLADESGELVFGLSSSDEKGKLRNINERYDYLFNSSVKKDSETEMLRNFFKTIDIKNFGATFAGDKKNVSIIGAVQLYNGKNLYKDTNIKTFNLITQFQNQKKGESKQETCGEKNVLDEAHFVQQFSINPFNYKEYVEQGLTDGYTEEDFKKFKEISLQCISNLDSTQKAGSFNEFAIFITLKENQSINMPNLSNMISINKNDENIIIYDLTKLDKLNDCDKIENIEIYYDSSNISIITNLELNLAKKIDIITMKEIK